MAEPTPTCSHFSGKLDLEMTRPRILDNSAIALAGLFFFFSAIVCALPQQKTRSQNNRSNGQQVFASNCAGCHGLDGTGTQRAPNIVNSPQVQKFSAAEMFRVISEGVPGTGMPAFQRLGKPAVNATVAYLRSLQGKNGSVSLPGNPERGKTIFFAAGGCAGCHMIAGSGGFLEPDLSTYGQTHLADQIRSVITDPAERTAHQGLVTAIAHDGQRYEGIVRNEDNFSLQLQSTDGAFHFLSKADLKAIERATGSIMPSDYGSKLTKTQLDDLVSYLLSVGRTAESPQKHPDKGE